MSSFSSSRESAGRRRTNATIFQISSSLCVRAERRHAGHADPVLHDPEDLSVGALLDSPEGEVGRRRVQAFRDLGRVDPRSAVADEAHRLVVRESVAPVLRVRLERARDLRCAPGDGPIEREPRDVRLDRARRNARGRVEEPDPRAREAAEARPGPRRPPRKNLHRASLRVEDPTPAPSLPRAFMRQPRVLRAGAPAAGRRRRRAGAGRAARRQSVRRISAASARILFETALHRPCRPPRRRSRSCTRRCARRSGNRGCSSR